MKKVVLVVLCAVLFVGLVSYNNVCKADSQQTNGEEIRFVVIPKIVHAWFDEINKGAQKQARLLSEATGQNIVVDYRAPSTAELNEQNSILEQCGSIKPAGIAIDPVNFAGSKMIIDELRELGIPVILYDAVEPDSGLTSVSYDQHLQAIMCAEKMVEIIGGKGKVAVMQGIPTASNHSARYRVYQEFFKDYPNIELIDGGIDNDIVEVAQQQAAAVLAANPDLKGYLVCDAAGSIGISIALEEAGKVDTVALVGLDDLIENLEYVKSGTQRAATTTKPQLMGAMAILTLYQAHIGGDLPEYVDLGIDFIDQSNVDYWINIVKSQ